MSDVPGSEILPDDQARVFLSYSRKDRERAQRIADVLRERHFGVFRDTDDILPTEEWRERLKQLIEEADTIVFLLSPHSVASEVCAWEIELAASLNKRIAPIVIDEVDTALIPPLLARLNFIFCTERDRFVDAVDSLVMALNTDIEWIREHTRLAGLAQRWERASRPDRLLLRGQDIADAEAWRDSRPAEAPDVTPQQAAFVARSRHAAGQRQRRWIAGSLGVAAATLALAIFAWVQSQDAKAQRAIAEEQRSVAEEQRSVAEEQRDVAEQRRLDVLARSTASFLRAGDRRQAVSAWVEATAQSDEESVDRRLLRTLLAGLVPVDDVAIDAGPGEPFLLNGALHMVLGDGTVTTLPGFPASAYETVGSSVALITPTGGARLHDGASGAVLSESYPQAQIFHPCFVDRGRADAVDVYSAWAYGYSACGYRVVATPITASGIGEQRDYAVCTDHAVAFGAEPDRFFEINGFDGLCALDGTLTGDLAATFPGVADLGPPTALPSYTFPAAAEEALLWQGPGSTGLADRMRKRIVKRYDVPGDSLERFAAFAFGDEPELASYMLPEIWESDGFVVLESLTDWGGTGGEAHQVCLGEVSVPLRCAEIVSMAGFAGLEAAPARGAVLIYGRDLESWEQDVAPHNLLELHADGTLQGMAVMQRFGAIFDLDLSPDETALLALTEVGIVTLSLAGPEPVVEQQLIAPEGALAVAWLGDGSMAVLDAEGGLHLGLPGEQLVRIATGLRAATDDERYLNSNPAWLIDDAAGGLFAAGMGRQVQLFSVALGAPVSAAFALADESLASIDTIEPVLIWQEDGAVALDYLGQPYMRRGPEADATVADYIDPDAPVARLEATLGDG